MRCRQPRCPQNPGDELGLSGLSWQWVPWAGGTGGSAVSRDGPQPLPLQTDQAPRPQASTSPPGSQGPHPGPEGSAHKLLTKAAASPNGPPSMPGPHPLSLPPPLSAAGHQSTDASGFQGAGTLALGAGSNLRLVCWLSPPCVPGFL